MTIPPMHVGTIILHLDTHDHPTHAYWYIMTTTLWKHYNTTVHVLHIHVHVHVLQNPHILVVGWHTSTRAQMTRPWDITGNVVYAIRRG